MVTVRKLPSNLRRGDFIVMGEGDVRFVNTRPVCSPTTVHVELRSGNMVFKQMFSTDEMVQVVVGDVDELFDSITPDFASGDETTVVEET